MGGAQDISGQLDWSFLDIDRIEAGLGILLGTDEVRLVQARVMEKPPFSADDDCPPSRRVDYNIMVPYEGAFKIKTLKVGVVTVRSGRDDDGVDYETATVTPSGFFWNAGLLPSGVKRVTVSQPSGDYEVVLNPITATEGGKGLLSKRLDTSYFLRT